MATWFQAPPRDRKRMARRSTSGRVERRAPQTWQRKPCSAKSSLKLMPDLAFAQRLGHLIRGVADGRYDPHAL
jgi:hypothetical protein